MTGLFCLGVLRDSIPAFPQLFHLFLYVWPSIQDAQEHQPGYECKIRVEMTVTKLLALNIAGSAVCYGRLRLGSSPR